MTKVYLLTYFALLGLLGLTAGLSYVNLGGLGSEFVALTIAVIKASLVILFFMHVKYDEGVTRVYVGMGFFWLLILLSLTMSDYVSRGWLPTS